MTVVSINKYSKDIEELKEKVELILNQCARFVEVIDIHINTLRCHDQDLDTLVEEINKTKQRQLKLARRLTALENLQEGL